MHEDSGNTEDSLSTLVYQSLLLVDTTENPAYPDGEARFSMLQTIREFGLELLTTRGELANTQQAMATYYLKVAEHAGAEIIGAHQSMWMARLEHQRDNIRAVLRWARETGGTHLGLRIASGIWRFWETRGHLREGQSWLEGFLAASPTPPTQEEMATRVMALNAAGALAHALGDYARSAERHEECLALRRAIGDLGGVAVSLNNLGIVAKSAGDYARAMALYEEAREVILRTGDRWRYAILLYNMGNVARLQKDAHNAMARYEESLAIVREWEDRQSAARILGDMASLAVDMGDFVRARVCFQEELSLIRLLGDRRILPTAMEGIATLLIAQDHLEPATLLLGAAAALRSSVGTLHSPAEQESYEQTANAVRAALGDQFEEHFARGRAMSPNQALDQAFVE